MNRDKVKLQKSILKLFKGLYIEPENNEDNIDKYNIELTIKNLLSYGIIINNDVAKFIIYNDSMLPIIISTYGKDKYLNNSFYKSYKDVAKASDLDLIVDRMLHYLTTYGYRDLGIYDDSKVYFPEGVLKDIKLSNELSFIKISEYSFEDIKEKVINLLNSGIALNQDTINDLLIIIEELDLINYIDINKVKNKEIKCVLSHKLKLIPDNGDEILRILIYIATGKTLLLRSFRTFREIQLKLYSYNERYKEVYNYIKLLNNESTIKTISKSFLRNKLLWLAFKFHDDCSNDIRTLDMIKTINNFINKLRRHAKIYHKPMIQEVNLHNISNYKIVNELVKNYDKYTKNDTIFTKIKAYNYISNIEHGTLYKSYRIRNGKVYVKFKKFNTLDNITNYKTLKRKLFKDIKQVIDEKIGDNKVYIPKNITYTAPTSEKKFINGIPEFSNIKVKNSLSIGVHWENVLKDSKEEQTDLDLKLVGINTMIGWDAFSRTRDILFTGDITDAVIKDGGATVAFLIDKAHENPYMLMLNNYTNSHEVEYKLIFEDSKESTKLSIFDELRTLRDRKKSNSIFDLNNAYVLNSKIGHDFMSQKNLGLYNNKVFYFTDCNIGQGITTRDTDYMKYYLKSIEENTNNMLTINELLKEYLVKNKEDAQFDLSLNNITTDTFIELFSINNKNK